jgi:autotransporter passenger strand-loop-strand repeat protein
LLFKEFLMAWVDEFVLSSGSYVSVGQINVSVLPYTEDSGYIAYVGTVSAGQTDVSDTVSSDGSLDVFGTASSTVVNGGGAIVGLVVETGGAIADTTINNRAVYISGSFES